MDENAFTPDQLAAVTEYVDVTTVAPTEPTALFIFGTNQVHPVDIATDRYLMGLAPLIITTGGVNRHNGIVEGQEFRRHLIERGVAADCIRHEDRSVNTWENVALSMPHLREALSMGLPITAICKWYHRRAIHCLRTLIPEAEVIYALTFEPVYSDTPITRTNWMNHPDGKRKVLREWQEVERRVADGTYLTATHIGDAWR